MKCLTCFLMKIQAMGFACTLLFLALLPAGSSAQQTAQKPENLDLAPLNVVTGTAVEGYTLTIATDKPIYFAGESVDATVTIKDVSREDGRVYLGSPYEQFRFRVLSPNGESAPLTAYGKRFFDPGRKKVYSSGGRRIKPGDEISICYPLNRIFDMTLAGDYKISAGNSVMKRKILPPDPYKVVDNTAALTSGSLTVTIGDEQDEQRFYQEIFQLAASPSSHNISSGVSH